jgi:hypothetical protein
MKTTAGHSNRVFSSKFKQDDPVRFFFYNLRFLLIYSMLSRCLHTLLSSTSLLFSGSALSVPSQFFLFHLLHQSVSELPFSFWSFILLY